MSGLIDYSKYYYLKVVKLANYKYNIVSDGIYNAASAFIVQGIPIREVLINGRGTRLRTVEQQAKDCGHQRAREDVL